jgi:photosystem II stability/assembly factor-like uncharacterized protein
MKSLFPLFLFSLLLFSCFLEKTETVFPEQEKVSGAYEALTFFGESRAYPNAQLPEGAYLQAWQQAQSLRAANLRDGDDPAPWESMGPHNRGGRTLAITFNPQNPTTMYAGSASGGLWRTRTGGYGAAGWERIETGFPVLGVSTIAVSPLDSNVLYIGTGEVYNYYAAGTGAAYRNTRGSYGIGILKSTDGGQSWEKSLDWSYDQNRGVWMIKMVPGNPDHLYAATTDGTYESTNAGGSWTKVHDVVMATDLLIHAEHPDTIIVSCGNFESPGYGIYRSTDGGQNWTKIISDLPTDFEGKIQLGASPSNPDIVYASIGNGFSSSNGATWLCRSDDFGVNWSVQTTQDYSRWQGWFSHDVAVHPNDPDRLTAIGITVWESTNGGLNLTGTTTNGGGFNDPPIDGPDGPPNYVHADCHDVKYHPENPDIIYIGNDGGIHVSIDGGQTYRSVNGGYQTAQFYNGFSNSWEDSIRCMGGLQDNGTIMWNGDLTWRRVFGGDGSFSAINTSNDNILFASYQFLRIQRSVNGGNNFEEVFNQSGVVESFIAPFALAPNQPGFMYAGANKIYRSNNLGVSWEVTNNDQPLDENNPALSMAISWQSPDVVYIGTAPNGNNPGDVFVTLDGGDSWEDVTGNNLPDRFPMDMAVDPTNDSIAYVVYSGFGTGHVFRTDNYGQDWEDISGDLPDVPTNAVVVDPEFPKHVYIGNDLGVFISRDAGLSWEAYEDGLPSPVMVFDLTISPMNRKLRLASHGNGAFQRDLLEEELVAVSPVDPDKTVDLNVWPNPVVEEVNISFSIIEKGKYTLNLYDAKGQLIRSETGNGRGGESLQSSWNISDLPSGSYFLELRQGRFQQSQSLIIE